MMYRVIIILFFCPVFYMQAQPTLIDKVVAVVGDKVVLKSEVEMQFLRLEEETSLPSDFRCELLNELMMQKMLLTQAELDSVQISEEEIESELDRRIRYFVSLTGSIENLESYYGKSVPEIKEEFRPDIKEQLLAQRMQSNITGDVVVTPAEIREYFNQIPPDSLPYYNAQVQIGQLVIMPKVTDASRQEARDAVAELRKRVIDGENLGTLAYLYSDDPGSAKQKGELPEFCRDAEYVKEFKAAAFSTPEGDISPVFETEFGYHIVEVLKRKGDCVTVRHILKIPKEGTNDLIRASELLDSLRNELNLQGITFAGAVERFSDDPYTKNSGGLLMNPQTGDTWLELDQLGAIDREIPFIIDTMQAGDYSEVLSYTDPQGKQGLRILYLKGETEPHRASLESDYVRIRDAALNEKKAAIMDEWMLEKIKRTYIRLDPTYNNCPTLQQWYETPETTNDKRG